MKRIAQGVSILSLLILLTACSTDQAPTDNKDKQEDTAKTSQQKEATHIDS
jgi:outer membrane biogenesis lipoprotein LolB